MRWSSAANTPSRNWRASFEWATQGARLMAGPPATRRAVAVGDLTEQLPVVRGDDMPK